MFVCGANTATNLQARYAAADLAGASGVGRSLAIVVWSTTLGAVLGPNLTAPGAVVAERLGVPALSGPFVFSALAWLTGSAVTYLALRPDPLVVAKQTSTSSASPVQRSGVFQAWPIVRGTPAAATGVVTVACAHAFMVGVMAMTPVHMQSH